MKLLKFNPKTNLTIVASVFLLGAGIVYGQSQQTPTAQLNTQKTAETSQTTPSQSDTSTGTDETSSTASASDISTPSTGSSPSDSTSSPSDASNVSDGTSGSTNQSPAQENTVMPVTAVSATLGNWTTPVQDPNNPSIQNSYKYCAYIYSDGSTQSVEYEESFVNATQPVGSVVAQGNSCVLANAPSPN